MVVRRIVEVYIRISMAMVTWSYSACIVTHILKTCLFRQCVADLKSIIRVYYLSGSDEPWESQVIQGSFSKRFFIG